MSTNSNQPPSPSKIPKLLTVKQVSDITNFSVREVRRWIADSQLPACKFGRALRVSEPDLAMLIAKKKYS
ncbi:helix-turn-helix domain-containing protein [Reyranella sp. MMS21-HV4-11]|uniref:Helix-turn-helix domain-containing protein n=1 Tax=Reyranella humidisoli TaxID=2849149 RepID=A0ABS6IGG2_9HYPH|nr:helix-turn-helix domain-containing protein [Reyranella sp. MMS21-HV4-11]MBU8873687.1 helix-turn-helix domain-containing protein [Reyranella sp. MMS21-HV4-11]